MKVLQKWYHLVLSNAGTTTKATLKWSKAEHNDDREEREWLAEREQIVWSYLLTILHSLPILFNYIIVSNWQTNKSENEKVLFSNNPKWFA